MDSRAYEHLIGVCGRVGDEERALSILKEMQSQSITRSSNVYKKLLGALAGTIPFDSNILIHHN